MVKNFLSRLRRLCAAQDGTIAVMGALALTSVLGMSGMAVELGNGYAAKVRNQRVADLAALAAASAYKNGGQDITAATQVARDVIVANGLSSSTTTVDISQVTVGTTAAIKVNVKTRVPIKLASLVASNAATYDVQNTAYASLVGSSTAACITALGTSTTAVSSTGGAKILANGCAITTNGTVSSANSSATVTAKQITAKAINDPAASYGQNGVTTNPTANNITVKNNAASDYVLAGNTAVKTALCYVNKLTGGTDSDYADNNTNCTTQLVLPTAPAASGSTTDIVFTSGTPVAAYASYYSGGVYNLPAGNYTFRNVTVNGGVTVNIGNGDFRADSVTMNGAGMSFGNGKVIVSTSFNFANGNTITIGNGEHYFGTLTVSGGRTLKIGSGSFTVASAVTESGGSYIYVTPGTGDAVTIGNTGTTGIDIQGGSYFCFSTVTTACTASSANVGTFSVNGTISTAGGSTLMFPVADKHVINGDLTLNGSSTFGAGLYIIKGNFTNNTGGTMVGVNVTFALGGTFTLAGGTSIDIAAPTSASGFGVADVLVATKSSAATTIGGGSQDKYSGLFYAPKSAMSISGGSSISASGSSCLMVLVSTVASSGSGTLNTSNCSGVSGTSSGTPALIQ